MAKKKAKKATAKAHTAETPAVSMAQERRIISQVYTLADPLCEADGLELVCVEYQREPRGRVLRLYLDKPGGVSLDDCAAISRQLGDILDVALEAGGAYRLEVSSPGPKRPLGRKRDFVKYQGNVVEIRTSQPFNGKKKFKGLLEGMSDDTVHLRLSDSALSIPHALITRARLVNFTEKTDVNIRH